MTREEIENECLVAEPSLRKMFVDFAFACCAKQVEEDAEIVQKLRVYRMTAAEIANVIRRNAPKVK